MKIISGVGVLFSVCAWMPGGILSCERSSAPADSVAPPSWQEQEAQIVGTVRRTDRAILRALRPNLFPEDPSSLPPASVEWTPVLRALIPCLKDFLSPGTEIHDSELSQRMALIALAMEYYGPVFVPRMHEDLRIAQVFQAKGDLVPPGRTTIAVEVHVPFSADDAYLLFLQQTKSGKWVYSQMPMPLKSLDLAIARDFVARRKELAGIFPPGFLSEENFPESLWSGWIELLQSQRTESEFRADCRAVSRGGEKISFRARWVAGSWRYTLLPPTERGRK